MEPKGNLIELSTFLKYGLTFIIDVRLGSKYAFVKRTLQGF